MRKEIDLIDGELLRLFERRMQTVEKIAKFKNENNLPTFDANRETLLLDKIKSTASKEMQEYDLSFFNGILEISKKYQHNIGKGYGLLGEKLSHSFSVQIHNMLADYPYILYEVSPTNIEGFLTHGSFSGLNVTIPYKQIVMPYCNILSDIAMEIGSVNTLIRMSDGTLYGDNTDLFGFLYLLKLSCIDMKDKKVMILGSGGSCKTVICAAKKCNAREIVVISRNGENNYSNISIHNNAQIIVNTTPMGMYPSNGNILINLEDFKQCEGVIDLIYNPAKTALLMESERLNIKNSNGLAMLVAQAKVSCELFGGKKIDDCKIEEIIKKIRNDTLNIVLVGMPGSGKSTVGRILSQELCRDYIDTDSIIKNQTGRTADDIIKKNGEEYFRTLETNVARDVGKYSSKIISTGGGIVTKRENFNYLRQNSVVIFLQRDTKELSTLARPLSKNHETLKEMYKNRLPLYLEIADYTVQNVDTPEITAKKIIGALNLF